MASEPSYIAVLKAEFDYQPQADAEDELAIKEDQIVLLLERTDEDWWKVRIKTDSQEDEGLTGLVPAAYVKPAPHTAVVKVLYDYEATQATELTVAEDEILYSYGEDEGWLLVGNKEGTAAGYIPGNYVEVVGEDGTGEAAATSAAPSLTQIVVPPSPPRPAYVDPADRVASNKAQADDIQTWAVSEVDKKGKKKKGTLGVGNGAIFFASESDKTPVQKWQTTDIASCKIDKPKHILIDIGGTSPTSLHFHAGSKDAAEAILAKLETSRLLAGGTAGPSTSTTAVTPELPERPRSTAPKAVHFDAAEPEIIPSPPVVEEDSEPEPEPDYHHVPPEEKLPHGGEPAVVLYDFTADGEDELSVREGETLVVLERDGDEWWKIQNQDGLVGVVPASYVELLPGANGVVPSQQDNVALAAAAEAEAEAAREAAEREAAERKAIEQERKEKERAEKERKAQAEQRAKAAAAAADADRRRREQERERKEQERAAAVAEEEARKKKQKESDESPKSPRRSGEPRTSVDKRGPPPSDDVRTWHDRTGQFKVDAAFLGFSNGKLRLHKVNGVVIEVPAEKMSAEDMRYVEKLTASSAAKSDDDEPLETRRKSLQPQARTAPPKKGPTIDWFDFFLNAGCDLDDCTRYAHAFERDKIDEALLPDLTESVMRTLGLREGDIIRVKKAIEQRKPKPQVDEKADQLRRDEELARQLQAEETSGAKRGPAPNLFAGPNGALKNSVRRGRPQPSKSLPPSSVDLDSIASASSQIQRTASPVSSRGPTPVQAPIRSSSAAATMSGFDDDAWTNRPSSTQPLTPTPASSAPRAPSAPPAPAPPPAPPAPPAPVPAAAPVIAQSQSSPPPARPQSTGSNLAKTTEKDVFEQLARLSAYKSQNAASSVTSPSPSAPPLTTSPPISYQSGLGMGPSPTPIGQHLQAQQTGMLSPPQYQQSINPNAPRGPFAPVPANSALLQPLIPTSTGFNSFVPTRPASTPSSFQPPQPPAPPPPPSFFTSQPTGFSGQTQPLLSQPTGFSSSGPLLSQPTGFAGGNFGNSYGNIPPVPPLPTNNGFGSIQTNPTGFNPGFGQTPFNQSISPPPPPPANNDTSPASVFAKMKSGTFATNDNPAPQSADMYNALRPNTTSLTAQPTGWGYGNGTAYGFQ